MSLVRLWFLAMLTMVLSSGCLGTGERLRDDAQATLEQAEQASACPAGHPFVLDQQSVTSGGSGEETFTLDAACTIEVRFDVTRSAGDLEVRVASVEHTILDYASQGVHAGVGVNVALPTERREMNAGTTPPGTYHYTWRAGRVAEFYIEIAPATKEAGEPDEFRAEDANSMGNLALIVRRA